MIKAVTNQVILALILTFLTLTSGQSLIPSFVSLGSCPTNLPAPKNFDLHKYTGNWFIVKSVQNQFARSKSCSVVEIMYNGGNELIQSTSGLGDTNQIVHDQIFMSLKNGAKSSAFHISATIISPEVKLSVLDTDYNTYACTLSCGTRLGFKAEFGSIMSRTPELPAGVEEKCKRLLAGTGSSVFDKTTTVVQGESCPYSEKFANILNLTAKTFAKAELLSTVNPKETNSSRLEEPKVVVHVPHTEESQKVLIVVIVLIVLTVVLSCLGIIACVFCCVKCNKKKPTQKNVHSQQTLLKV